MTGLPPETPAAGTAPAPVLPWEQAGAPFLGSLFETAGLFFSRPVEAYRRMPVVPRLGRPVAYAVIFGWAGIIASQLWSILLRGFLMPFIPRQEAMGAMVLPMAISVVVMVVAPILVLIGLFLWSAIVHLFLMLVGGANAGLAATIRVIAYAGTTNVLQAVPLCGGLVATVWNIVLVILGLAVAHKTTQVKAALAVLLPLVLCCVCVGVVAVFFGAVIAAAIGNAR